MSSGCGCAGKQVLEATTPTRGDLADLWRTVDEAGELRSAAWRDGERQGEGATAYVPATEHVWLEVPTSADRIRAASGRVLDLLLEKNQSYGDTALNPLRILSKLDAYEGLAVRADDKLSRLKNAPEAFQEDALLDLAGYLILMLAARGER